MDVMNATTDASHVFASSAAILGILAAAFYVMAVFAIDQDNRASGVYGTVFMGAMLMFAGASLLSTAELTSLALITGAVLVAMGSLVLIVLVVIAAFITSRAVRAAMA